MSKPIPKGKQIDGDMTQALDGRFLNALILGGALAKTGKDRLPVTIDRVEYHDVLKYENGSRDKDAYLLYFQKSDKPLKLAKKNTKRLIAMFGPLGSGWHGKKISLVLEKDRRPDLGGQMGDCVRVLYEQNTSKPQGNPFAATSSDEPDWPGHVDRAKSLEESGSGEEAGE